LQGYTVPGIRSRSAETTVELGSGQSFVIAGLDYDTSSVTKDKVPLLGDIPIIGALFKRQETLKERQELVIVVTPRLVDPLKPDEVPSLPGEGGLSDPTYGQMIVGDDGVEQAVARFGVERR
jgi:pilus assembly protein CpaC